MKYFAIAVSLAFLLASCGGGGSGDSPLDGLDNIFQEIGDANVASEDDVVTSPTTNPPVAEEVEEVGDGAIIGRVATATDNLQLADTEVTLSESDGDVVATTSTDELGVYAFNNLPRNQTYLLTFVRETYLTEVFNNFTLDPTEGSTALEIPPIRLLSTDNAGTGSISGVVNSAVDGDPLAGVTLEFVRGINNPDGELAATTMSDANGQYTVDGLEYGNYTCIIFADGLQTSVVTIFVVGNTIVSDQNATLSPIVVAGQTRIVLTWGETPRDLDSHFTGPTIDGTESFRVYFSNRAEEDVQLDTDDTSSFGPETITIENSSRPGVFRYTVRNFSGGELDTLSNSSARVQVIRQSGIVAEFFVPQGEGNIWSVFDMENGEIRPLGNISILQSNNDYFAPETLLLNANASTINARNNAYK